MVRTTAYSTPRYSISPSVGNRQLATTCRRPLCSLPERAKLTRCKSKCFSSLLLGIEDVGTSSEHRDWFSWRNTDAVLLTLRQLSLGLRKPPRSTILGRDGLRLRRGRSTVSEL